jgi:hypothetical protein
MDDFPGDAENYFRSSLAFKNPSDPEFCLEANWRVCKKFYPLENGPSVSRYIDRQQRTLSLDSIQPGQHQYPLSLTHKHTQIICLFLHHVYFSLYWYSMAIPVLLLPARNQGLHAVYVSERMDDQVYGNRYSVPI